MTIEDCLIRNATLYPEKTAVVCGNGKCSYGQLLAMANKISAEYKYADRLVPFRFTPTIEAMATYFAIHLSGHVAVPLDKSLPENIFQNIANNLKGLRVPEGTADILYTTGTTGLSKGVIICHDAIIADAENLIDRLEYSPDLTFIISGPLNHIGSLSKIYPVIYVGATMHIIDGLKEMNTLFDVIAAAEWKAATFLVPSSIKMLLAFAKKTLTQLNQKIDFIEAGAAPLHKKEMQELSIVLPSSRLYNTYASTETGIIASYNYNTEECIEGCVGLPMRHSEFALGDDGQIICKGRTLMTGYLNDQKLTDSILHDGGIYTSDIGTIDNQGRLHLIGRKDDIINVGGFKVSPVEIESLALNIPGIKDCVCIAASHPLLGSSLRLLYVADKDIDAKEIIGYLRDKVEAYKIPSSFQRTEAVKRTFNGKLDRKAYS